MSSYDTNTLKQKLIKDYDTTNNDKYIYIEPPKDRHKETLDKILQLNNSN